MLVSNVPQGASSADHERLAIFGVESEPQERTLVDIAQETFRRYPDIVGLESDNESLTYSQVQQQIAEQVKRLHNLGIGKGDRIGIRVPSGTVDLYIAILSTIFAGAAYVPVDWDDPDSRANTVWEEAGVAAVYGKSLELDIKDPREHPHDDTSPPSLDDDAWIIFTSGSTGKPKGVAITHRSAAALVDAEQRMYLVDAPLGPQDRVMAGLSVAFDASCEEMWLAWRTGATLVAAHRDTVRSGDVLGRWLQEKEITAISTVPTLAAFWSNDDLARIRLLIFGGEALPFDLIERLYLPGREIWNTYGPTEATVIASGHLVTPEPPVRIGRPVPGWQLVVVNDKEEIVEWGETGQLIIGGVGLGRYLDKEKDDQVYAPLPAMNWERAYRTGDLVVAEPEGLVFAGRADDQIKFAGRRLELGEIDDKLTACTNVRIGAAQKHKTPAGSDVLVGYLVAEENTEIDLKQCRDELATTMPGGIVPVLCVLDEMPTKTSGKVDRKALPWPLPSSATGEDASDIPSHLQDLAKAWTDQLGPIPLDAESNFFDLGGSSVAVAKLAAELRKQYPTADIAELYQNPTLESMGAYLHSLGGVTQSREMPNSLPLGGKIFQAAWILAINGYTGLRYALSAVIVVWVLSVFGDAAWVPRPPLVPLLIAWLIVYSPFGKMLITAAVVRACNYNLKPGVYARGGKEHLRIWAAERFFNYQNHDSISGTPFAPLLYRMLGNTIGNNVTLNSGVAVTGLTTVGDNASIENEIEMAGYWIDGSHVYIGAIEIGAGARVGMRSTISPGSIIGAGAEILPGSHVNGFAEPGKMYEGAPLRCLGPANQNWPADNPNEHQELGLMYKFESYALYAIGMLIVTMMPAIAFIPGAAWIATVSDFLYVRDYHLVFLELAEWTIPLILLQQIIWLCLTAAIVRLMAVVIKPGFYPQGSFTAWALWLTTTLMAQSLESFYFIYASWLTPAWMRMCGATVGKDVEISTVVVIPHLTRIEDGSFLADDAMACPPRFGHGWVHIGSSVVGKKSFVGNSAILGIDRDMPSDSLLAVLSTAPYHPEAGSSWLGRTPSLIPRQKVGADSEKTYRPPLHLRVARAFVEAFRIVPSFIAFWIDLGIVYLMTAVYVDFGMSLGSFVLALLLSGPIVVLGYTISALIPVVVKWIIIGKFRPGNKELHSSFVWRNELSDNFNEYLAVPTMVFLSLGTPFFNIWARLMGSKIGKDVWCDTWWLPEFDLIEIRDRATINSGTVIQTHLFHDRVMSLEPVVLEEGSTLGPSSFMLPGSSIGARTTIGPASLILRHDQIPPDSIWEGNPVHPVDSVTTLIAPEQPVQGLDQPAARS